MFSIYQYCKNLQVVYPLQLKVQVHFHFRSLSSMQLIPVFFFNLHPRSSSTPHCPFTAASTVSSLQRLTYEFNSILSINQQSVPFLTQSRSPCTQPSQYVASVNQATPATPSFQNQ